MVSVRSLPEGQEYATNLKRTTVGALGVPLKISAPSLKISSEWNLWYVGMEEQPVQTLLKTAKNDFLLRATQDAEPDFSVRSDPH